MPSNPSCCTVPSSRLGVTNRTHAALTPAAAGLLGRFVDEPVRASRHPRVEPPLRGRHRRLLAVSWHDLRVAVEGEHARADGADLLGKVLEVALVRNRAAAADHVAGK